MKYSTRDDRHSQIKNAIMATSKTGVAIYIKHGNYFPKEVENGEVLRATWDQFYIDGREDGFPKGFQTFHDIEKFLEEEIERLEARKIETIISNNNESEGVVGERWGLLLLAWQKEQPLNRCQQSKRNEKGVIQLDGKNIWIENLIIN